MDHARLIRAANDIARNLACRGEEAAITVSAQMIRENWDPRMKAAIPALDRAALSPIARAALDLVCATGVIPRR